MLSHIYSQVKAITSLLCQVLRFFSSVLEQLRFFSFFLSLSLSLIFSLCKAICWRNKHRFWLPGILFKIRTLIAPPWTHNSTWRLGATSSSVSFWGVETLLGFIIIFFFVFAAFTLSEIHKIVDKIWVRRKANKKGEKYVGLSQLNWLGLQVPCSRKLRINKTVANDLVVISSI